MIRLALAVICLSLFGCAAVSIPTTWTLNRVVNSSDGVILVWRAARYSGGEFNSFDRNPVGIAESRYWSYLVTGLPDPLRSIEIPVDYAWTTGQPGSADPHFVSVEGRLLAHHCVPSNPVAYISPPKVSCAQEAQPHAAFRQLGSRAEPIGSDGGTLIFWPTSKGSPECRLDLRKVMPEATKPFLNDVGLARFGVAYFPDLSLVYVLDHSDPSLPLYRSSQCGDLRKVASVAELAKNVSGGDSDGAIRSLQVIDIAPETHERVPNIIVSWSERLTGVYKQRFGVLVSADRYVPVQEPIGFWSNNSQQLLINVVGSVVNSQASADITVLDIGTGQASKLHVSNAITDPDWTALH
jgi:hypothetical protein